MALKTKNELKAAEPKDWPVAAKKDKSIEGYNVGMNCGEVAGQTIFHCHIHLIPRRKDDVESPRGGIRNIIPGKGSY
jgi:diadenosine tetraphosphate (Ap4A) HIT family hydrolase